MSTLAEILGAVACLLCVVAGGSLLVAAWRGSAAARRVIFATRSRVADLVEGGVAELSGTISFAGDGVVSPSGKRCAAAQVTLRSGLTKPENGAAHTFSRGAAQVLLTDLTGSVLLELEHVEIVAPTHESKMTARSLASAWMDLAPEEIPDFFHLLVAESVIEEDAAVTVRGRVERLADGVAVTPDGGYRDGAPRSEPRYRVVGRPDDRLLLTQGHGGKILWRIGWPALALLVFGSVFLVHAGVLLFLLLA